MKWPRRGAGGPRLMRAPVLFAAAVAMSCSSVQQVRLPMDAAKMRDAIPDAADVKWNAAGAEHQERAVDLTIIGDQARWTSAESAEKRAVPLDAVRTIQWTDHAAGARHGFLGGGLAMGGLLAIAGAVGKTDPCAPKGDSYTVCEDERPARALVFGFAGFLAGGVIGLLGGAIAGDPVTLELIPPVAQPPQRDPRR